MNKVPNPFPSLLKRPEEYLYWNRIQVVSVTDGDTIKAVVQRSFKDRKGDVDDPVIIRFARMDAYEKRKSKSAVKKMKRYGAYKKNYVELGLKAKEYVTNLFAKSLGMGFIRTYKRGTFGRMLAEVYITDGKMASNLNDDIVGRGLGFYTEAPY